MVSLHLEPVLSSSVFHSDQLPIGIRVWVLALNAPVWANGLGTTATSGVVVGGGVVLWGCERNCHADCEESLKYQQRYNSLTCSLKKHLNFGIGFLINFYAFVPYVKKFGHNYSHWLLSSIIGLTRVLSKNPNGKLNVKCGWSPRSGLLLYTMSFTFLTLTNGPFLKKRFISCPCRWIPALLRTTYLFHVNAIYYLCAVSVTLSGDGVVQEMRPEKCIRYLTEYLTILLTVTILRLIRNIEWRTHAQISKPCPTLHIIMYCIPALLCQSSSTLLLLLFNWSRSLSHKLQY